MRKPLAEVDSTGGIWARIGGLDVPLVALLAARKPQQADCVQALRRGIAGGRGARGRKRLGSGGADRPGFLSTRFSAAPHGGFA